MGKVRLRGEIGEEGVRRVLTLEIEIDARVEVVSGCLVELILVKLMKTLLNVFHIYFLIH